MFWNSLHTPIIGLSPMDGVTDAAFRFITKKYGNPDVLFTEFVSADGICHSAVKLLKDLIFTQSERPIAAQIFGNDPESFRKTAVVLCELGFDGIDINMGCPANSIAQRGGGAALIQTPQLAQKLILGVRQGIEDWKNGASVSDLELTQEFSDCVTERKNTLEEKYLDRNREIPVSVKTRIGYSQPVVKDWIPYLLEVSPAVISVHGRTLVQQYGGSANWEEIAKAKEIAKGMQTYIFGNGDISSHDDAIQKIDTYGLDGALIGRASFGNPWVFIPHHTEISWKERMRVALEHAQYYDSLRSDGYFLPMRKHLGWYMHGHPNATKMRQEIYQMNSADEFEAFVKNGL